MNETIDDLKNLTFTDETDDLIRKKLPLNDNHNNEQRTILAHHMFHANIKHTIVRFIRETPV